MTVGEKIQYYRKKLGLSQEELGQKLLVSRQTVSLWEMDKTLPTVDNLLRLKEIFSVSIDDILCEAEPTKEAPKETYVFKFSKEETQKVFKKERFPFIKRAVAFAFCVMVLFVIAAAEAEGSAAVVLLALFFVGVVSHLKAYLAYKKTWKLSEARILNTTYRYDVFEEYFLLNLYRDEELVRTQKIRFEEIEKTKSLGKYLLLQYQGQVHIIKKDTLIADSAFVTFNKTKGCKPEVNRPKAFLRFVSILLFCLSVCSVGGAMLCIEFSTDFAVDGIEKMWMFFLFLPIPIASVAFGFYLKKKGHRYLKNLIVGIIVGVNLCIFGSFSFIFSPIYSHSDEPILNAEQMLDIDIPKHSKIYTNDWESSVQPREHVYYVSRIYFDDADVEEFEKSITKDNKWLTDISNDMIGIVSFFCAYEDNIYCIIYNKDTKEFNKTPRESGTYNFINVSYNADENIMTLVEYEIEYTK